MYVIQLTGQKIKILIYIINLLCLEISYLKLSNKDKC